MTPELKAELLDLLNEQRELVKQLSISYRSELEKKENDNKLLRQVVRKIKIGRQLEAKSLIRALDIDDYGEQMNQEELMYELSQRLMNGLNHLYKTDRDEWVKVISNIRCSMEDTWSEFGVKKDEA